MVRRSLIALALFAVAAPSAAQIPTSEPPEWMWTADRPDANGPAGVFGARTLEAGEIEVSYRYYQTNWEGLYFGTEGFSLADAGVLYSDVPMSRRDIRHQARLAWGLTGDLTLHARAEFAVMERDMDANGGLLRIGTEALGDVEVGVLFRAYASGPYRIQVHAGGVLPTGQSVTYADTTRAGSGVEVPLPYDMRPGGGTFGVTLGASGSVQNEVGSLGGQFRFRTNFGENLADGVDFRLGDRYDASIWAAYNVSSAVAVSSGVRWEHYRPMDGTDPRLDAMADPENAAPLLSGQRAHLPIGVSVLVPAGSRFAGHRVGIEGVYSLHHNYDAPQLGQNWGFNLTYTVSF